MKQIIGRREFISGAATATAASLILANGTRVARASGVIAATTQPGQTSSTIKIADKYNVPMFSREEFERRWAALQQRMDAKGIDCLLMRSADNVRYVSGACGFDVWYCVGILPKKGKPSLIMPVDLMFGYAREILPISSDEILALTSRDPMGLVAQKMKDLGMERALIGVDDRSTIAQLKKELPNAELIDASDVMLSCMRIKSTEELAYCRRAQENAENAFLAMAKVAKPGVTAREIIAAGIGSQIASGSDPDSGPLYNIARWPDPRPSGQAYPYVQGGSEQKLQKGDFINLEYFPTYCGYQSFVSEPIYMGKPPADFVRMFVLNKGILRISSELLRPGHTQKDIDDKVAEYLSSELKEHIVNSIDEEGRPSLIDYKNMTPHSDKLLKEVLPGEVIAIAPMSFWYKGPNHLVSDVYLTTEGAPERISKLPVEIVVV